MINISNNKQCKRLIVFAHKRSAHMHQIKDMTTMTTAPVNRTKRNEVQIFVLPWSCLEIYSDNKKATQSSIQCIKFNNNNNNNNQNKNNESLQRTFLLFLVYSCCCWLSSAYICIQCYFPQAVYRHSMLHFLLLFFFFSQVFFFCLLLKNK